MNEDSKLFLTALLAFLGGTGGTFIITFFKDRREAAKGNRKDAMEEAYTLVERYKKIADEAEEELREERTGHHECRLLFERAMGRIEMLEEAVKAHGIKVRPWSPHGSDLHTPLGGPPQAGVPPQAIDRRVIDDPNYDGPERRKDPPSSDPKLGGT